jgi:excisionase family DNA binding protein
MMALTDRAPRASEAKTPAGRAGGARVLYRVPEAMRLLSLSRSMIYNQIRAGRLRTVKQGSSRLIPAEAIADYVALLKAEAEADR